MNKTVMTTIIVFVAILLIWIGWSFYIIRGVESPDYEVVSQHESGYEIRKYAPYLIAEVEVEGDFDSAINNGFRLVADYIFGNNQAAEPVAMTTPVLEGEVDEALGGDGEAIAMTTPVLEGETMSGKRTVAFVMPAKYTLETIPKPNNSQVQLKEIDAKTVAVLQFGFFPTANRVEKYKAKLQALLTEQGIEFVGTPKFAGYNPPFSFPFLIRNEVQLELKTPSANPVRSK